MDDSELCWVYELLLAEKFRSLLYHSCLVQIQFQDKELDVHCPRLWPAGQL